MKLLFCRQCGDLFKLRYEAKSCECGEVSGAYKPDGDHAWIEGSKATLLGLSNYEMAFLLFGRKAGVKFEGITIYPYPTDNGKIEVLP